MIEMGMGVSLWFRADGPLSESQVAYYYGDMALRLVLARTVGGTHVQGKTSPLCTPDWQPPRHFSGRWCTADSLAKPAGGRRGRHSRSDRNGGIEPKFPALVPPVRLLARTRDAARPGALPVNALTLDRAPHPHRQLQVECPVWPLQVCSTAQTHQAATGDSARPG